MHFQLYISMKVFFFPIVPIVLFFCLGIILHIYYTFTPIIIATSLLIGIIVYFITTILKKRYLATLALLFIWTSIGYFSGFIHHDLNYKLHYNQRIKQENINVKNGIVFTITEKIKPTDKFDKYVAEISAINNLNAFGKFIISIPKSEGENITIGTTIIGYTQLQAIQNITNPYQFSYAKYLSNQNIYAQAYLTENNYRIIGIKKDLNFYVDALRVNLISSFNIHNFPKKTQEFINAFLLGQRQELDKTITEQYTQAGVVHILAISGLHISILYGILLVTFKSIGLGYQQRYIQLIVSLIFLWIFAFVTGLPPSVVRCVTMFSVIAIATTLSKNQNIFNIMGVTLVVILLINPKLIFEVGFQLSYLSVLIIIISNPLFKKIHITKYKLVHYITDLIAISFLVQLFLLPLIIYYFKQVPTLFLLSNLLVIPVSSFLLYLLVLVLTLNYIFTPIALLLGKIVGITIEYMNWYVAWVASFKNASIQNIPCNELLFFGLYALIISLFFIMFKITYTRVLAILFCVLLLTVSFIYTNEKQQNTESFMVWNVYKQTVLSNQSKNEIVIYSSDTTKIDSYKNTLLQNHFYKETSVQNLKNYYIHTNYKVALINSEIYYNANIETDYLILSQSPKINLDRVIKMYNPKHIICDGNNYKSYSERWEKTCKQKNIPFYNTYKMGYYIIKSN